MSEYNYNFGGMTNGVFKMPGMPASYRTKTTHYNTTQSTFNPSVMTENFDNSTLPDLKMIEQRLDLLKLMCQPEEMIKIEADLGRHLAEANRLLGDICCQKFGERLLGTNIQPFFVGTSSVHSMNLRNVSRTHTTDNHFGLLNPPISASGYATNTHRAMSSHQGFLNDDNTGESVRSRVSKKPAPLDDNTGESVRTRVSKKPAPLPKNIPKEIPEGRVIDAPSLRSRMPKKPAPTKKRKTEEIPEPRISTIPSRKLPRVEKPSRNMKKSTKAPKLKEIKVLASDDDDDSIMGILEKMSSKVIKKKKNETDAEPNKPKDDEISAASSTLEDTECSYPETIVTRARKPPQAKTVTSIVNRVKNSDRSPDTTFNPPLPKERNGSQAVRKTKNRDVAEKVYSDAARRKQTSKANNVNSNIANTKNDEETSSHKPPEVNGVSGFEELDERSFFSNISSINGGDSPQIGNCNVDKNANRNNDHRQYDLPSGYLSPLTNARSTSGFSAISTPLSKTAVKNALDKRLKKPNVAAELKDQLIKKRRKPKIAKFAPPVDNSIESSESESDCQASDFSD